MTVASPSRCFSDDCVACQAAIRSTLAQDVVCCVSRVVLFDRKMQCVLPCCPPVDVN